MKKALIVMCMTALFCSHGYAQQKGDMAAGINLGVAPCLESGVKVTNFGIGAKFQYNVTNPIRLEADLDYWFKDKGMDMFDISANVQYLFHLGNKINVYPFAGIGYARVGGGVTFDFDDDYYYSYRSYETRATVDFDDISTSLNRFLFNVGVGAEYEITNKISAGVELKYQYLKNFSRFPITIGATYHF